MRESTGHIPTSELQPETASFEPDERDRTALDALDGQLDRLRQLIDLLDSRLEPVSFEKEPPNISTVPEPRSPLYGRVQRLDDLCVVLDRMIMRLDV
jgi:hypothetical protein